MNRKKQIRQAFRDVCFKRDKNRCRTCPSTEELTVHHITDRNEIAHGGYVKENGITLCPKCHKLAEVYHENGGEIYTPTFHPSDLYELIGSSYQKAVEASERLS